MVLPRQPTRAYMAKCGQKSRIRSVARLIVEVIKKRGGFVIKTALNLIADRLKNKRSGSFFSAALAGVAG